MKEKNLPPPFKIRLIEPIKLIPPEERRKILGEAGYNPYLIPARYVYIDLVSDSGTSALSVEQLSRGLIGDESFSYQNGYFELKQKVREIFGFPYVLPFHQGRGIESCLFTVLIKKGNIIPSNTLFETTRANIEMNGGESLDITADKRGTFGGDIDIQKLDNIVKASNENIPFVLLTITNNSRGGLPLSIKNLKQVRGILRRFNIPIFIDGSRYAENIYFNWKYEMKKRKLRDVVREFFSYSDLAYMSGKKDALSTMGGLLMTRSRKIYNRLIDITTLREGFPSHGGLSDRDIRVLSRGIEESIDESYITYRVTQVHMFGEILKDLGIPILEPIGGHAVYIRAKEIYQDADFPAFLLAGDLFIEGGIRGSILGGVLSNAGTEEYLRLAIPRRTYTDEHLIFVSEILKKVLLKKKEWDITVSYLPREMKIFATRFKKINKKKR